MPINSRTTCTLGLLGKGLSLVLHLNIEVFESVARFLIKALSFIRTSKFSEIQIEILFFFVGHRIDFGSGLAFADFHAFKRICAHVETAVF